MVKGEDMNWQEENEENIIERESKGRVQNWKRTRMKRTWIKEDIKNRGHEWRDYKWKEHEW